jgi:hypothetical protein
MRDGLTAIARRKLDATEVDLSPQRAIAVTMIAALCAGCFAPFPHDRHDLVDFRIVGVQVSDAAPEPGGIIQAKALVYGGDGFYHDTLPTLEWRLGEHVVEGPQVELAVPSLEGSWEIELLATHADGLLEERAVLPILVEEGLEPVTPPVLPPVERAVIDLPMESAPEDLLLTSREQLEPRAAIEMAEGQAARLRLPLEDPGGIYQARWMSVGGQGTFLEIDALTTDWLPGEVFLEEEDVKVEVGEELAYGRYGMAVLVIDGRGSTAWRFVDVLWNEGRPWKGAWYEHEGRLLASEGTPNGLIEVEFVRDDDSPWGFHLDHLRPHVAFDEQGPPLFLHPPCEHPVPLREPFQLDWIAEGLCSREAVLGHRAVVRVGLPHTWGTL